MSNRHAWRSQPTTLEEWKSRIEETPYAKGKEVRYHKSESGGIVVSASVDIGLSSSLLGCFFLSPSSGYPPIQANTGWVV